jgi:tRNA A37 threonylcarbamoyladenosine modification protein TsaB
MTGGSAPEILFRSDVVHRRSDSSAIFDGLQSAVATCGSPDAICVGLGPGSYNGLRAGIAAARAFASALDLPLLALHSPLALPALDYTSECWVVGDARGGHYWIASIREGVFLQEPHLLPPSEILTKIATRPEVPIFGSAILPELDNLVIATPDAGRLAILAEKADPCFGTPEPLYLKSPHITAPRTASACS